MSLAKVGSAYSSDFGFVYTDIPVATRPAAPEPWDKYMISPEAWAGIVANLAFWDRAAETPEQVAAAILEIITHDGDDVEAFGGDE